MKGKLAHWDENKGFGFISINQKERNIFIHISSLKKMNRRPIVGDILFFDLYIDNNGKKRATNAKIQGVNVKKRTTRRHGSINNKKGSSALNTLFSVIFLLIVFSVFFNPTTFFSSNLKMLALKLKEPTLLLAHKQPLNRQTYHCETGKIYCSQMTSCQEATFYLRSCPSTKMDGNHDGIPCERQWCK